MGLNLLPGLPEGVPVPPTPPKENFILTYKQYADIIEAPADAHEAVAMVIIASLLNRNGVYIEFGHTKLPFDLWVLLISPSGMGRNTLVRLADEVLKKAGLQDLVRSASWGSPQALYQDIAAHPRGLYQWEEMSVALKKLGSNQFNGTKEWITDRYDNYKVPEPLLYRKTGKKGDTPPIMFAVAPRLNILATSSEDWLTDSLAQSDTTGGFLPRFTILKLNGTEKVVPIPPAPDDSLQDKLAEQLRKIAKLKGCVVLSKEVQSLYKDWYVKTRKRFMDQPNAALAMPFFNRLRIMVPKLAVIHEAAESGTLEVSPAAMKRAFETAAKIEATIFELLPTGMNAEGAALAKMADRIKTAGVVGISKTQFTEAFKSVDHRSRMERLATLRDAGDIVPFGRPTKGRPLILYVFKDYVQGHQQQFPEDRVTNAL
ncbi:MAG TPA: DUF3987 domain-containing protein [Terriglobales bacterium]|jgi:hypothetical protein|nr:DUF3987 domain-containing protein [Terriglobales bacterium]